MIPAALRFYEAIPESRSLKDKHLVAHFIYFLTVEQGHSAAGATEIIQCFVDCDLMPPSRLRAYLSEGAKKGRDAWYVKAPGVGYRLQRTFADQLSETLGSRRVVAQTSAELRALEATFPDGPKKAFLAEAVDCFEANANRAAIVLSWLLAVDHLFDVVFRDHLEAFNAALAANPDRRVRRIVTKDDFSDLKESKFIELCRAGGIISNSVRKILDDALGVRNTAAHPSGVEVSRNKAVSVIEDLVVNVVRKFPL